MKQHSGWYKLRNGRVQWLMHTQAKRRNLAPAMPEEIQQHQMNPPKGCGRCGSKSTNTRPARIIRWLGLDWYGVPYPKRLRLRWPIYLADFSDCGCIKPLKDWMERRRHG